MKKEYSKHAIDRFFSRYKVEISPDEILYIQRQIEYGLDETKLVLGTWLPSCNMISS